MAAFAGGIAFVYSCGDGSRAHAEPTGVHWISSLNFVAPWWIESPRIAPSYLAMLTDYSGEWPVGMWAPVLIPYKCTITEIQFRARDQSDLGDIFVGIYDQSEDPVTEEDIPIAYKDTSGWASTGKYNTFSTGAINLPYDPTNFEYNNEWYIMVQLNDTIDYQRVRWVKILYTTP